jgi:hypothetical protein
MLDMKKHALRARITWRLAGFLLVLVAALGAQAEPPSAKLPGRKTESKEPWGAFLGRAAHFAIGRRYSVPLYRWSYRREKPQASWKERAAQKEEALPREEAEQRGEIAEQVLRAAYEGGKLPNGFQGQIYLPVDCH